MFDFIFDNIAIIGLVLFILIGFVVKICETIDLLVKFFGKTDSQVDAPKCPPVRTQPENKPVSYPQNNESSSDFPKTESTLFDTTKEEQLENFDDDVVEDNSNVDAPRKLAEQMTAQSHFLYGGNSHTPDESILREEDEHDDVILSENLKDNNSTQNEFTDILKDNNALRKAFVASEILGKPKSMR